MTTLRGALVAARSGQGGLSFIIGDPGTGKSRLVREVTGDAERHGITALSGRAVETLSPVPFQPLSHAFLAKFRAGGPPPVAELQPLGAALGRLVPEWRDERRPSIEDSLVLVAEAVVRLLRVLAGDTACLLVLEDLQWADPETLAVVEYLADNLSSEPVLCLATLRAEKTSRALAVARSLGMRRTASAIDLGRLGAADVDRMAAACLRADALVPALVEPLRQWTEGVPLFVEELLAAWITSGVLERASSGEWSLTGPVEPVLPRTFAEMIERRLRGLDPDARQVLRAAAVLGRRFDWALLPPVSGLTDATVLAALRSGIDAQLVAEERDRAEPAFSFRHTLIRDAVLAELLAPDRVYAAEACF